MIAVLGLEVIKEFQDALLLLKYVGGTYLVFLGYRLITSKKETLVVEQKNSQYIDELSVMSDFIKGFLSGFLNPKNIIFYLSLFTVMVSIETRLFTRCLYALWMCSMVLLWDVLLAILVGHHKIKQRLLQWIYIIEKISGAMLATFGILLVW